MNSATDRGADLPSDRLRTRVLDGDEVRSFRPAEVIERVSQRPSRRFRRITFAPKRARDRPPDLLRRPLARIERAHPSYNGAGRPFQHGERPVSPDDPVTDPGREVSPSLGTVHRLAPQRLHDRWVALNRKPCIPVRSLRRPQDQSFRLKRRSKFHGQSGTRREARIKPVAPAPSSAWGVVVHRRECYT